VPRRARAAVLAVVVTVGLVAGGGAARAGDDDADPAYLQHDLDNVARSTVSGRQRAELEDLDYGAALAPLTAQTFLTNVGRQVADLPEGRTYLTLGQLLPGGAVGNPLTYRTLTPQTVAFTTRTGAKLVGRIWLDGRPGAHPGIVITPGSLQGTQHMYFWAARTLAQAGYEVLTFDVQGQGESEAFGHQPPSWLPTGDGFPFQQEANFVDGTVDTLRFLLSSPAHPYVPGRWTATQVRAAQYQADPSLDWYNPGAAALDATRIGLAGHSLGARAISVVQQCSDLASLWKTLPLCTGRSFPIRAVVAWDRLSDGVRPVVPAMDQEADGYFLFPQPTSTAPNPDAHLTALRRWQRAGVDTYSLTIRGGTHLEWVDVPYILPSTTYGVLAAARYTRAWMDRYVAASPAVQQRASTLLLTSPKDDRVTHGTTQWPWAASFLSANYRGGFSFHDPTHGLQQVIDLRRYGGASRVGDWAGANADQPAPRSVPAG
jgi:dienelactone hydrolase